MAPIVPTRQVLTLDLTAIEATDDNDGVAQTVPPAPQPAPVPAPAPTPAPTAAPAPTTRNPFTDKDNDEFKGKLKVTYPLPTQSGDEVVINPNVWGGYLQYYLPLTNQVDGGFKQGFFFKYTGDNTFRKGSIPLYNNSLGVKYAFTPDSKFGYFTVGVGYSQKQKENADYQACLLDAAALGEDASSICSDVSPVDGTRSFPLSAEWLLYPEGVVKGNLPIVGLTYKADTKLLSNEFKLQGNGPLEFMPFGSWYAQGALTYSLSAGSGYSNGTDNVHSISPMVALLFNPDSNPDEIEQHVFKVAYSYNRTFDTFAEEKFDIQSYIDEFGADAYANFSENPDGSSNQVTLSYGRALPGQKLSGVSLTAAADGFELPFTADLTWKSQRSKALGPEGVLEEDNGTFHTDEELGIDSCLDDFPETDGYTCTRQVEPTSGNSLSAVGTVRTPIGKLLKRLWPTQPDPLDNLTLNISGNATSNLGEKIKIDSYGGSFAVELQFKAKSRKELNIALLEQQVKELKKQRRDVYEDLTLETDPAEKAKLQDEITRLNSEIAGIKTEIENLQTP